MPPNVLAIRIQPNEGITLSFQVKKPGPAYEVHPFSLDFAYGEAFGEKAPDAYERLLLDAAHGDSTLFTRSDEVEAAWSFVAPVLDVCADADGPLAAYPAGSWGPAEGDRLIEDDGRRWELMRRKRVNGA